MQFSTLSRTSSAASISSDDGTQFKQFHGGFEPRRTRKRFTSAQLVMLEQLFHQSSHPTREEREAVARATGMEMKSVTIWFQNKRQTERKALHHATTHPADAHRAASLGLPPSSSPTTLSTSLASTSSSTPTAGSASASVSTTASYHRTHARTHSTHTPRRKHTPPRARPSLDRVATRSESRLPPPRTPTRPRDPHASLWDNMPSSPLAPPASPPAHDLVAFLGGSRTLEWACAAARLAEKDKERQRPLARELEVEHDRDRDHEREGGRQGGREQVRDRRQDRSRERDRDGEELTEDDDVEAVTPQGSFGVSDAARWHGRGAQRPPLLFTPAPGTWPHSFGDKPSKEVPQDEDMMRAALALCGLGRRSG